jgi:hypothetical protein
VKVSTLNDEFTRPRPPRAFGIVYQGLIQHVHKGVLLQSDISESDLQPFTSVYCLRNVFAIHDTQASKGPPG